MSLLRDMTSLLNHHTLIEVLTEPFHVQRSGRNLLISQVEQHALGKLIGNA
jgi:hypothetical protein